MDSWGVNNNKKAGYEYLLAWKITVPIYDYTVGFCKKYRHLLSSERTYDQMVQSARSGMANIAEGNRQDSTEGYIKRITTLLPVKIKLRFGIKNGAEG
jgi:hypothetical protein